MRRGLGGFGRSNVCWWKVWESRRALYLIAAEVNRLRLILWIFTPFIGGGRRRRRRARRKEVRWLAGTGSTTWGSTLGGTQLGTFCGVGPCHPVYWLDLLQRVQRSPDIYRLYKTVCNLQSLSQLEANSGLYQHADKEGQNKSVTSDKMLCCRALLPSLYSICLCNGAVMAQRLLL